MKLFAIAAGGALAIVSLSSAGAQQQPTHPPSSNRSQRIPHYDLSKSEGGKRLPHSTTAPSGHLARAHASEVDRIEREGVTQHHASSSQSARTGASRRSLNSQSPSRGSSINFSYHPPAGTKAGGSHH
jgi:hypothetical protein